MGETRTVAKRVFATVPDAVAEDLEAWADSQGRSMSNLVGHLLENAIKQAKSNGEFPESKGGKK